MVLGNRIHFRCLTLYSRYTVSLHVLHVNRSLICLPALVKCARFHVDGQECVTDTVFHLLQRYSISHLARISAQI